MADISKTGASPSDTVSRKFSFAKPFVYLALTSYLLVVIYPMLWLLYTALKTDREIFLNPFSLPDLGDLQWINFTNAKQRTK